MENNYAAREKRRIRYNAAILTFLSVAATIVGFISWLSNIVLEIGQEVPIP
jgi:hypothetical protein